MLRPLIALALGTVLATQARAQCQIVPNTGCPGATAPLCAGSARIGHALHFEWNPMGLPFGRGAVLVGLPAVTPLVLPPNGMCAANCTLAIDPSSLVAVPDAALQTLTIPNDPGLIGLPLRFQAALRVGFLGPGGFCAHLTPALQIAITG